MKYPAAVFSFILGNVRVEREGSRTILTHLQKFSHFGFMFTWPFCFHFWLMPVLQAVSYRDGSTVPNWHAGTERGIYFRTPGYRYDKELGMKWTWGYFGFHLD